MHDVADSRIGLQLGRFHAQRSRHRVPDADESEVELVAGEQHPRLVGVEPPHLEAAVAAVPHPLAPAFQHHAVQQAAFPQVAGEESGGRRAATETEDGDAVAAAVVLQKGQVGVGPDGFLLGGGDALGDFINHVVLIVVARATEIVRQLPGSVGIERVHRLGDIRDDRREAARRIGATHPQPAFLVPVKVRGVRPGLVIPSSVEKKNVVPATRGRSPVRGTGDGRTCDVTRLARHGAVRGHGRSLYSDECTSGLKCVPVLL